MEADWARTRTCVSIPVRLLRQRLSRLAISGERSGQGMMVDQPRYKNSDEVDFVIVGSGAAGGILADRKSTRLNSSHRCISYAVFCLKKKKKTNNNY